MDLDTIEGLNEIRPLVYRATIKLQSLQKLCHMNVVFIRHITAALSSVGGAQQDVMMSRGDVTRALNRMFHSVLQEVQDHVTVTATEETCSLMFRLFDSSQSGGVSARSLQTALIALSSDNLQLKYRGLLQVSVTPSGSISRSGLRCLLQDLSQVPAAVQEEVVFGSVEAAVRSCFNGVLTPAVSEGHVLSWLQSEPRLLLWLPTLYRLSATQKVRHDVRCHACKTFPFAGLRYRCMKCVNVHLCQSCFLTSRQTRKHKTHHPVLEFCTQPTWRESLTSLVHSARHKLLPRRQTQREADRRRALTCAESEETDNRATPPSHTLTRLANAAHSPSLDRCVFHDATAPLPPHSSSRKSLQMDRDTPSQQAVELLAEVRNLQRDQWLLEQELRAWRLTVQSEHSILADRCSEMGVTMETIMQHNTCLQGTLTQALSQMEAQQHAINTSQRGCITLTSDPLTNTAEDEEDEEMEMMEDEEMKMKEEEEEEEMKTKEELKIEEEEEEMKTKEKMEEEEEMKMEEMKTKEKMKMEEEEEEVKMEEEWRQEKPQIPFPTIHQGSPLTHAGDSEEEESADDISSHYPIKQEYGLEEAGLQGKHACLSEEEDSGICSPEELLQEAVKVLKAAMETDRRTHTGQTRRAGLLEAAEQVSNSMLHLVDAVQTN